VKAKLIHHGFEWLEGDFEAPALLASKPHMTVWRVEREPGGQRVAMKLESGAGVWDASGKLLLYSEAGADLAWLNKPAQLLGLESRFGPCRNQKGVRHAVRRLSLDSASGQREQDICVVSGGPEYLIVNHACTRCLATWLDQNVWGYVVIDVETLTQLPGGLYWPSSTLSPPAFSPDDAFVVSCHLFQSGWWTDDEDEYWESPSPGGPRKVGTISVHDARTDAFTHHEVIVHLPAGWLPVDGDNSDWDMIWGPLFVSEREFQIWLPDGSTEVLQLPLPPRIEIHRTLSTQRLESPNGAKES
jgi:hypothetical protein